MKKKIKASILFIGMGLLLISPCIAKGTPITSYGTTQTGVVVHNGLGWTGTYSNNWCQVVMHELDYQTNTDEGIASSVFSSKGWAQTPTVTSGWYIDFWSEHRTNTQYITD